MTMPEMVLVVGEGTHGEVVFHLGDHELEDALIRVREGFYHWYCTCGTRGTAYDRESNMPRIQYRVARNFQRHLLREANLRLGRNKNATACD